MASEHIVSHDKAPMILATLTILLLTAHVAQDVAYGIEAGDISDFIAAVVAGVWLYATLALAGRRSGYILLLVGSFLAPVVPLSHMAGAAIAETIRASSGGAFFVWTLLALGVTSTLSFLASLAGLWRLKHGVLSFALWAAVPLAAGGALLGFVVYELYLK